MAALPQRGKLRPGEAGYVAQGRQQEPRGGRAAGPPVLAPFLKGRLYWGGNFSQDPPPINPSQAAVLPSQSRRTQPGSRSCHRGQCSCWGAAHPALRAVLPPEAAACGLTPVWGTGRQWRRPLRRGQARSFWLVVPVSPGAPDTSYACSHTRVHVPNPALPTQARETRRAPREA